MHDLNYTFTADLWIFAGPAAWYFVTLPKDTADEIKFFTSDVKRGWGSVRVQVTVGDTTWKTSIFPAKERGSYLLPVKKDVRKKESLAAGEPVTLSLKVLI